METAEDEADAREFEELAISAGAQPAALVVASRRASSPRYLFCSVQVEEMLAAVVDREADVVRLQHTLSWSQVRTLEQALTCRVLVGAGLILHSLEIRARSHEGKLQLELAQLKHSV